MLSRNLTSTRLLSVPTLICACVLVAGLGSPLFGQAEQDQQAPIVRSLLSEQQLSLFPDHEGSVMTHEYPPGYDGVAHRHTGDVFIYVLSGTLTAQFEGGELREFQQGDVYYETVDNTMVLKNTSTSVPTKILIVQVGPEGESLAVPVDG